MATMAADSWFVDTNVLVYANQSRSAYHADATTWLKEAEAAGAPLWISGQVLREDPSVVTRLQGDVAALPMAIALDRVRLFAQRFWVAEDGPEVRARLFEVLAAYDVGGKQVHDANAVATMLTHGITRLLTFNAGDFSRFADIITLGPTSEA